MARVLTYRKIANNFQAQAELFARLFDAKVAEAALLPQGEEATVSELQAVTGVLDQAISFSYQHDSNADQATDYNVRADTAEEPA